jgi:hypothetical protein
VENRHGTVETVYTPGHAGVSYNETADKLAGDAVAFGNLDMTVSDVIASIIAAFHKRDDIEDFTFSMYRLREREAERGGRSLVLLKGCQRRTATQIRMGVISRNILKELPEMFEGPVSAGATTRLMQEQEQDTKIGFLSAMVLEISYFFILNWRQFLKLAATASICDLQYGSRS